MCLRGVQADGEAPTIGREWKTKDSIAIAVGAIFLVGSVFAALAAFQVFPHGANAFSRFHIGSLLITGSIGLTGAAILTLPLIRNVFTDRVGRSYQEEQSVVVDPREVLLGGDLVGRTIAIDGGATLEISADSILMRGEEVHFGAIGLEEAHTGALAYSLLENESILAKLHAGEGVAETTRELARVLRENLPERVKGALLVLDKKACTYSVEVFGGYVADPKIWDGGVAYAFRSDRNEVDGSRKPPKENPFEADLKMIKISVRAPRLFGETRNAFTSKSDSLPKNHWIDFGFTGGDKTLLIPHPDHESS